MTLFVGLGNPGPTYTMTRHNIGWRVLDKLIELTGATTISKKSFHGHLYRHGTLLFLQPTTFMNLSGKSVQAVQQFFKIPLENVVVVHDDIDLDFGVIRFKKGGGNGGHNGLRSLDSHIGKEYVRVRFGVGKPPNKSQVSDYVLKNFTTTEEEHVNEAIDYLATVCRKLPLVPLEQIKSLYSIKKPPTLTS